MEGDTEAIGYLSSHINEDPKIRKIFTDLLGHEEKAVRSMAARELWDKTKDLNAAKVLIKLIEEGYYDHRTSKCVGDFVALNNTEINQELIRIAPKVIKETLKRIAKPYEYRSRRSHHSFSSDVELMDEYIPFIMDRSQEQLLATIYDIGQLLEVTENEYSRKWLEEWSQKLRAKAGPKLNRMGEEMMVSQS